MSQAVTEQSTVAHFDLATFTEVLEFLAQQYEGPGNFFQKMHNIFTAYKLSKIPVAESSVDDAYTEDEFE